MTFDTLIHDPGVQAAGAVLITVFVVSNVAEFAWSQYRRQDHHTFSALIINLTLALFQQLSDVFNKLLFILGYVYVQEHFSLQSLLDVSAIPVGMPLSFTNEFPYIVIHPLHAGIWLGILLLADFCQYWLHRLSHEVNILWAGHIVHHSMEAYNFAVALRQSFIESMYTWVFYLPLAFLGVPWPLFIMAYSISLIWQFLVHTRYIDKLGWLEIIMSTPSHHRAHHGKNDRYIDKNYGALFIIWDKFFGTFEPESEPVAYGVKSALDTHNPLWVNVHHHVRIGRFLLKTRSWKAKLRVLFGPPAFVPSDCTEPVYAGLPAGQQETAVLKKTYILLNFLGIAALAVMQIIQFDTEHRLIPFGMAVLFITGSHIVNIGLLEGRKWADWAEIIRLLGLFGAGILLQIVWPGYTGLILAGVAVVLLGFTFWIAQDDKQRQISSLHAH